MRTALILAAIVLSATADDNFWTSVPGLKAQNLEADAAGNLWAIDSDTGSMWFHQANQDSWAIVDEVSVFTQVSVNDVGVVWAIGGTVQEPTAPHVLRRVGITPECLTGTGWETVPGAMVQLSVGPGGNVVALDGQNRIYFRKGVTLANPSGSSWQVYEATMLQVSYSNNGQIWGTNADTYAYLRRDTSTGAFPLGSTWDRSFPGVTQVSACSDWVYAISATSNIRRRLTPSMLETETLTMPKMAFVDVSASCQVWAIGTDQKIWKGNSNWHLVHNGPMNTIAADGEGNAIVVTTAQKIMYRFFRWEDAKSMKQLSVGPQGNMIAVSQAGQVWVRIMVPVASSWVLFDTSVMLQHVSWSAGWQIWGVDIYGQIWGTSADGKAWYSL
eukprot:m51a1_g13020 hypothetical protein (386) ;mRNA; r:501-2187